jgi:UDP-N-acetylglucosamine acyltransferase
VSGDYYISGNAVVGAPPEHREWAEGDPIFPPIGDGARINAFATVDAGMKEPTRVGARSFLMKHAHVGHDAQLGDDCELAPGAVVCGHAVLGDGVRMGVNSCVRPFIRVGDGARIGMGAVVVKDVPPSAVVVGNPARVLEKSTQVPITSVHLNPTTRIPVDWDA